MANEALEEIDEHQERAEHDGANQGESGKYCVLSLYF